MKAVINREVLLSVLAKVVGVANKKMSLPILECVLVNIENNYLSIRATNLEIEITAGAYFDGYAENGSCAINAKKFFDICKNIQSTNGIAIELKENKAVIKNGKSKFVLNTLDAKDYPALKNIENANKLNVNSNELKALINASKFAIATNDVRYYLCGLYCEFNTNKIITVATDGHRLAKVSLTKEIGEVNANCIIPKNSIDKIVRLLPDNTEIAVTVNDNLISFSCAEITLISKLIDGKFPEYQKVIPADLKYKITLPRVNLLLLLNRANTITEGIFKGVNLIFTNNALTVTTKDNENSFEEELELSSGIDNFSISFNISYLLDVINTLNSETIDIFFNTADSPLLIRENDNCYVVMPMRI
jgi:DNA polymerase-3 subunit beta